MARSRAKVELANLKQPKLNPVAEKTKDADTKKASTDSADKEKEKEKE